MRKILLSVGFIACALGAARGIAALPELMRGAGMRLEIAMDIDVFHRNDLDSIFRVLRTALRPDAMLEPPSEEAPDPAVGDRHAAQRPC
jgi:hypothetical protein